MLVPAPQTVSLVLTLVLAVYTLLVTLIFFLIRKKRNLVSAAVLFAVIPTAAAVAAVVCRLCAQPLGSLLYGLLIEEADADLTGLLAALPSLEAGLHVLPGLLLAPVLFGLLFLLLYFLFRIIAGCVLRIPFGKPKRGTHLAGSLIGVASGILFSFVTMVPLCLLLSDVPHAALLFLDTGADKASVVVEEVGEDNVGLIRAYAEALDGNPMVKAVDKTAGVPIQSIICTAKLRITEPDGTTVTMSFSPEKELNCLAESAGYAVTAVDSVASFTDTWTLDADGRNAINQTFDTLLGSEWLSRVGAEAVSGLASAWLEGKPFLSMDCPSTGELTAPTVRSALRVLSEETGSSLRDDVHTVLNVLYHVCDSGILQEEMTYNDLMMRLWSDGLLDELLAIAEENPRLLTLCSELKALGIRVLTRVLGSEAMRDGTYGGAYAEIAPALNRVLAMSPEERTDAIRSAVQEAFDKYDVSVPDGLAVELAEELIDYAGGDGEITPDEVQDFLTVHFDEVDDALRDEELPNLP